MAIESRLAWLVLFALVAATSSFAQIDKQTEESGCELRNTCIQPAPAWDVSGKPLEKTFFHRFLDEQKNIWTSPTRLKPADANWLVPLSGVTAGLITVDADAPAHLPGTAPYTTSTRFSDIAVGASVGSTVGLYAAGWLTHNERLRRTGWLAGEAVLHSYLVTGALKLATGRERPLEGSGRGEFGQGGSSFPSEHSAAIWSVASVYAHEHPSKFRNFLLYGAAVAASVARTTGREHFPSDVLVGSLTGYLIGRDLSRRYGEGDRDDQEVRRAEFFDSPGSMGSTYVPLDSWVYSAFDRLQALGVLRSGLQGQRPWTRLECTRLMLEAKEYAEPRPSNETVESILASLRREFAEELDRLDGAFKHELRLDAAYLRTATVLGEPLNQSLHFAQTIVNDSGRPFGEGANVYAGAVVRGASGRFAAFVQGEFQHAGEVDPLPPAAQLAIGANDSIPNFPAGGRDDLQRFRLLDSYVAFNVSNFQFSFGKQSLWWGPARFGSMLMSTNAEPISMIRINRVSPLRFPQPFRFMGPVRFEAFAGELGGHEFIRTSQGLFTAPLHPHPFIHGERLSFRPTRNLEFGFASTTMFAGSGYPLTLRTFFRSYSLKNTVPGLPDDPGDRRSGFDVSYRVPKLRDWVTVYADAFTEDEFSPVAYFDKSAFRPGLYLPKLPKLHAMDFRAEGVFTDLPKSQDSRGIHYFNFRFLSGYTNQKQLIGDWIGRSGSGVQLETNYWLSPERKVSLGYRMQDVTANFLGGGDLHDLKLATDLRLRDKWRVTGGVQYESWRFPLLSPERQQNLSITLQLRLEPHWGGRR